MDKFTNYTNELGYKNITNNLTKEYQVALKEEKFSNLVKNLKIKDKVAIKYTSKLQNTVCELINCSKCKALGACKNKVTGYVNYPELNNDNLVFNYVACKYMKKIKSDENRTKYFNMPDNIRNARMKDIDTSDIKRRDIIKFLKEFYDNYNKQEFHKGLYLHGSFGNGKTYLISAMLNELSNKNYNVVILYFPELLRTLKEKFDTGYNEYIKSILNADILLLDDIGAESVTEWGRDEILGTILQHRMDNNMSTFFTSNLSLEDLETHLATGKKTIDLVKARRIIERIKYLSIEKEMNTENKRGK